MLNSSIHKKKCFLNNICNNYKCLDSLELFIENFLEYKKINETLSLHDNNLSANKDNIIHISEEDHSTFLFFKEDNQTTLLRVVDDKVYFVREYDKNEITVWFNIELQINPEIVLQFELKFDKENNIAIKHLNTGFEKDICEVFVLNFMDNNLSNEIFETLEIFYDYTFSNIEKNKIIDSCVFLKKLIKNDKNIHIKTKLNI